LIYTNRARRLSRGAERRHPIRIERKNEINVPGKASAKYNWQLVTEAFAAILNESTEEVVAARVNLPEASRIFLIRGLNAEIDNTMRIVYGDVAHAIISVTDTDERRIEMRIATRAGTQLNETPA
jgi:SPP1 family predicted phage head-tail adaptor